MMLPPFGQCLVLSHKPNEILTCLADKGNAIPRPLPGAIDLRGPRGPEGGIRTAV